MTPAPVPVRRPHLGRWPAYLRRFLTLWVAEEPDPVYSSLDRCDGLGRVRVDSQVWRQVPSEGMHQPYRVP